MPIDRQALVQDARDHVSAQIRMLVQQREYAARPGLYRIGTANESALAHVAGDQPFGAQFLQRSLDHMLPHTEIGDQLAHGGQFAAR